MKSHLLIIADGRSPTTRSWIDNTRTLGYDISLISTYPCEPPQGLCHFTILPLAFSRLSSGKPSDESKKAAKEHTKLIRNLARRFTSLTQRLRYYLGPLTISFKKKAFLTFLRTVQPDLVHALRIPFEGMLGAYTPSGIPFLAATWGNDLTLHANGSFLMRQYTRRCLFRANGLTADTHRDLALAQKWGLSPTAPTLMVPGSGGLNLDAIRSSHDFDPDPFCIPPKSFWVVNPRGLRPGSVHQDVFFAAIPKVLSQHPDTVFICPGLADIEQAKAWAAATGCEHRIFLLPNLPQPELWALFKRAQVFVSPSSHDGTPNSLLEAMACSCFPVVGNIDSMRPWVEDSKNGLLVNPLDAEALASAILTALDSPHLRRKAADYNLGTIKNQASQTATQPRINQFYSQFLR